MVKVVPPPYPEALTVKFWDKAKGLLARVTKVKTGITEELQAARKVYDDAPWQLVGVNEFLTKHRKKQGAMFPDEADALFYEYLQTVQPHFKKLEMRYVDLSNFLKKKAGEFEQDDKTAKFAGPLRAMADAANKFTYAVAWGTVSSPNQAEWVKLKSEAAKVKKQWDDARGGIKDLILKADKAVKTAKGKKTDLKAYNAMWSENLRGIGAQIAMAGLREEFAAPMKLVAKEWSQAGLPKKEEDVAPQLVRDEKHIEAFKKIANEVLK
jgi:hypothetical protein